MKKEVYFDKLKKKVFRFKKSFTSFWCRLVGSMTLSQVLKTLDARGGASSTLSSPEASPARRSRGAPVRAAGAAAPAANAQSSTAAESRRGSAQGGRAETNEEKRGRAAPHREPTNNSLSVEGMTRCWGARGWACAGARGSRGLMGTAFRPAGVLYSSH